MTKPQKQKPLCPYCGQVGHPEAAVRCLLAMMDGGPTPPQAPLGSREAPATRKVVSDASE